MHPAFQVHILNEGGIAKAEAIASKFDALANWLVDAIPQPSREMSLVITKLEEASFFAKKAMANQTINQKETV
jgi:hypothetical protein